MLGFLEPEVTVDDTVAEAHFGRVDEPNIVLSLVAKKLIFSSFCGIFSEENVRERKDNVRKEGSLLVEMVVRWLGNTPSPDPIDIQIAPDANHQPIW